MRPSLSMMFWVAASLAAHAQITPERQVLASAGASLSQGSLELCVTLGEGASASLEPGGSPLTLNLGFQQNDLLSTDVESPPVAGFPTVWPNPFHDGLTILFPADFKGRWTLLDPLGHTVLDRPVPDPKGSPGLDPLPSGAYILQWTDTSTGQTSSLNLLKQ